MQLTEYQKGILTALLFGERMEKYRFKNGNLKKRFVQTRDKLIEFGLVKITSRGFGQATEKAMLWYDKNFAPYEGYDFDLDHFYKWCKTKDPLITFRGCFALKHNELNGYWYDIVVSCYLDSLKSS